MHRFAWKTPAGDQDGGYGKANQHSQIGPDAEIGLRTGDAVFQQIHAITERINQHHITQQVR